MKRIKMYKRKRVPQLNIAASKDLIRDLKKRSIIEGISIKDWVTRAILRTIIHENKQRDKKCSTTCCLPYKTDIPEEI